jgi:hypothetical protein
MRSSVKAKKLLNHVYVFIYGYADWMIFLHGKNDNYIL